MLIVNAIADLLNRYTQASLARLSEVGSPDVQWSDQSHFTEKLPDEELGVTRSWQLPEFWERRGNRLQHGGRVVGCCR
jgi:hypothetical protein